MILVVLSTVPHPFPRAVRMALELQHAAGDPELRVQFGHTPPGPDAQAQWRQWYSRAELGETMRAASAVIVHGGSGCIFEALRNGVRPIAIPRLARYGEHVDDHQLELCSKLARARVIVSWSDGEPAAVVRDRLAALPPGRLPDRPDIRPAVWAAARRLAG